MVVSRRKDFFVCVKRRKGKEGKGGKGRGREIKPGGQ